MKKFILILTFCLQGCIWQTTPNTIFEQATKLCQSRHSELVYVSSYFTGIYSLLCKNGESTAIEEDLEWFFNPHLKQ